MTQTTKRLDAADRTVLFYGLLAALLGLGLHFVAIHRYRPWDQPFTMVFLLQLAWLAPLAGALLSGMRSGARWLIALAAYVLVLPLLAAYGLGWDAKNMLAVVSDSQRPMLITFLIGAAGFVLLPLVQELDPRQPQWNYPAVFRAAWRNTVHLALAVCLSISVFVLLWIAGMMFRMIGINTVLDVLGHARFHIAAWPIVLAVSLVGVRRRPQIADTLRRSWLTLNAWLLPLVALVGLAFTIALAARMALGFEAVKLSAGALIAFCALWIKLINAAWQDSPAAPFGQGLSRTLRLAMLCLLPLAAVALYGLGLRVGQYGWTIPRVWALYCGGLLALYALATPGPRCGPRASTARWRRPTSWPPSPRWSCWRWCRRPWPTRAASPRKASCRACWTAAWNRANTATAACATTTAAGGAMPCASWPTAPPASAIRASRRRRRAR